MNREIKFRAWSQDTNSMKYSDKNGWYEKVYIGFNGVLQSTDLSGLINHGNIPLMQYTGLNDSKGNEIYEGDIVNCEPMCFTLDSERLFTGEIKFYECCYWIDNGKEAILLFSESNDIEVIGNIHENADLLK